MFSKSNHRNLRNIRRPMVGTAWAMHAYNKEKEAKVFSGTLIGIVVSFFIVVLFAFLLNLAETYWYLYDSSAETKEARIEQKAITEDHNSEGFISWHKILGIKTAQAASYARTDYKATLLLRSAPELILAPGEETTFRIGFKNSGEAVWFNNDRHFISIYTYGPKYRQSKLRGSDWYRSIQPAKLKEAQVNPGALGFIEFKIKAPNETGSYEETFHLASEDKAWIEGGEFTVPIIVVGNKVSENTGISSPTSDASETLIPTTKTDSNYSATLLLKSHEKIEATAGETISVRLGFKNTGSEYWQNRGLIVPASELNAQNKSIFYSPTWTSGHQPISSGSGRIEEGQLAFLDFKIKAPNSAGSYTLKLQLVSNYDKEVLGGYVELPVVVTGNIVTPIISTPSAKVVSRISREEPIVEIGLYPIDNNSNYVELTANKNYRLTNGVGATLANLSANESIRVSFNFYNKIFSVQNARLNLELSGELHFKGLDNDTVFTILSMSRPTAYGHNDNQYRDEIILRQALTTGRLWVINSLPMEHYLWGIAETSNISHLDYIKAIIVAARTYALRQYDQNSKYAGYFDMRATTHDQLYRGYGSELRRPRVKQAAQETAGQAVTYNAKIVLTPYFGHSDGRTRGWQEVWGGNGFPWLVSKSVPSDEDRTLWGHGVGMSAKGAYHNAENDGWDYTKILNYYYTGTEVSKVY